MSLGPKGLHTPIHGAHPSAYHPPIPKTKVGGMSMPHIHPSAAVRLPRGEVNTSQADPAPSMPGVGRF